MENKNFNWCRYQKVHPETSVANWKKKGNWHSPVSLESENQGLKQEIQKLLATVER